MSLHRRDHSSWVFAGAIKIRTENGWYTARALKRFDGHVWQTVWITDQG